MFRFTPSSLNGGVAQAEINKAEAQAQKVLVDAQVAQRREDREDAKAHIEFQKEQFKQMMEMQQQQMDDNKAIIEAIKTEAETLKTLREAIGADGIITPGAMAAYQEQADIIQETQDQI